MLQKWELYRCTLSWVHTQLGRIFEPTSDFQKEIIERVIGCKLFTELCVKGICWAEKQSLALEPELWELLPVLSFPGDFRARRALGWSEPVPNLHVFPVPAHLSAFRASSTVTSGDTKVSQAPCSSHVTPWRRCQGPCWHSATVSLSIPALPQGLLVHFYPGWPNCWASSLEEAVPRGASSFLSFDKVFPLERERFLLLNTASTLKEPAC